jgi:type III restriction enzyme
MSLIINSPFQYPARHHRERTAGQLEIVDERRPASYEVFDARNNTKRTVTLDLVNVIRERVNEWRAADYPGVTIITRKLLEHWNDPTARQYQFYFCQLEAIETLIWWVEGLAAEPSQEGCTRRVGPSHQHGWDIWTVGRQCCVPTC